MKSMADIKHSMRAVQDTSKITKAMYLISTAKVRKALNMYESNSTYFSRVREAMKDILLHSEGISHPYLGTSPLKRPAFLVLAAVGAAVSALWIGRVQNTTLPDAEIFVWFSAIRLPSRL